MIDRAGATDYGGQYLKIRKALHEAGFDEFHRAGSVSQFHKMYVVVESAVLGMRYWFCVDGGYTVKDEFFIIRKSWPGTVPSSGRTTRLRKKWLQPSER